MSIVQSSPVTTRVGGVTGRGFQPGQSGNPGGRPRGLSRRVRELVGEDGRVIAQFMLDLMNNKTARNADRLEAAKWLADRGFGKAALVVDVGGSTEQAVLELLSGLSTEDLVAARAIYAKHSPEAAELAESGELRIGESPARPLSRQR